MATKDKKTTKKRSLSWAVPAQDNDLYIRALDACAELRNPKPKEDQTHGCRSSLVNYLIFKHFFELGIITEHKQFNLQALEKIEAQVEEQAKKPQFEKKGA